MADKLIALRHERRDLSAERQQLIAEFRSSVTAVKKVGAEFQEMVRQAQARLEQARERARVPKTSPGNAGEALKAALDAYDGAFVAPSKLGLPSAAAIAAYLAILPEPEAAIRAKLAAALATRGGHPGSRPH